MKKKIIFISILFFSFPLLSQTSLQKLDSILMGHHIFSENEKEYCLDPEVEEAFEQMKNAALQDSIDIEVVSSFRSYASQKRIWNRKFKRFTSKGLTTKQAINKIIEYSTLPGTSRHHWGTDVDLVLRNSNVKGDILLDSLFHGNNPFSGLRKWLENNAAQYGFYLVYDNDSLRKGFKYEPWHYSYKRIAENYLNYYVDNKIIFRIKKDTTVLGHEAMDSLFLAKYEKEQLMDIHPLFEQQQD